ncbi:HrcA family transcriptional regulator [Candidatus Tenderia electrophaga]|jgi:heat-inducible transcriptional repressor|uniref:Heat-inducible transcription repressor HrcA n=1 Tax=Candidatus Tenderia electrophaga TaxID=1748243 RepID=A0A0S2TC79_9GAMM|nr:HrcA family transcriptional regulator [Candidatus Tenderia electrophaga]
MAIEGLNERSQHLLRTLIETYIQQGQPVGSRSLAHDSGLDISAATVRNVMADLEALGLIVSPHTSAGRIPTAKGYRLFVDSLLQVKPLQSAEVKRIEHELQGASLHNTEMLISRASGLLSDVTRLAGVVMVPNQGGMSLQHIEFMPLSGKRVLAILVISSTDVRNVIIDAGRDYAKSELEQIANYLNAAFAGKGLRAVRETLLREMRETKADMDAVMQSAIEMADKVFSGSEGGDGDYVMAGQTNLMEVSELSQVERLRRLFEAFNEKRDILYLLDNSMQAKGVKIFIGEESGYQVLDECSVVTAPYEVDGQCLGVLGVIGPTRMAYERVIPIVDVTAKLLGYALNRR